MKKFMVLNSEYSVTIIRMSEIIQISLGEENSFDEKTRKMKNKYICEIVYKNSNYIGRVELSSKSEMEQLGNAIGKVLK